MNVECHFYNLIINLNPNCSNIHTTVLYNTKNFNKTNHFFGLLYGMGLPCCAQPH